MILITDEVVTETNGVGTWYFVYNEFLLIRIKSDLIIIPARKSGDQHAKTNTTTFS